MTVLFTRSIAQGTKNPRGAVAARPGGFQGVGGDDLLSHSVAAAVPSACQSLTSVFGMGTGGASELSSPPEGVRVGVGIDAVGVTNAMGGVWRTNQSDN